jgi:hypothetical protein
MVLDVGFWMLGVVVGVSSVEWKLLPIERKSCCLCPPLVAVKACRYTDRTHLVVLDGDFEIS